MVLIYYRRRRLFCRNGVYLRVTPDKRVAGTTNPFDPTGRELYVVEHTVVVGKLDNVMYLIKAFHD